MNKVMTMYYHFISIFLYPMGCIFTVQADICVSNNGTLGYSRYNPGTEHCCGGVVHKRFSNIGEELGCCGGRILYNRIKEICCSPNIVRERYIQTGEHHGQEQICCGRTVYRVTGAAPTQKCCGNQFSKEDGCCNQTTPFNTTISDCVQNRVVPLGYDICNGEQFDSREKICCADLVLNNASFDRNTRCCGPNVYDEKKHQCCKGKIHPLGSGRCCGTDLYNIGHEICCRNKIFNSNGSLQCCGGGTYNVLHQECCQGNGSSRAIPKEGGTLCCRGSIYNTSKFPNSQCCGNQMFSISTNLCCKNDVIIKKDATNHTTCCGGKTGSFHSCEKKSRSACGKQTFDGQTDLCCNNKIHKNAKKRGKRCCNPGIHTFDPDFQICSFGEVTTKSKGYNPSVLKRTNPRTSQVDIGICSICSDAWTNYGVRRGLRNNMIDICRENGYILTIKNYKVFSIANKTRMDVTVKRNIHMPNTPRTDISLELPCKCGYLQKPSRKNILLLTDLNFRNPPMSFYLGDSDVIVPKRRKILKIIIKRSRYCDKRKHKSSSHELGCQLSEKRSISA